MKEISEQEQAQKLMIRIYEEAGMKRKALLHKFILSQHFKANLQHFEV